MLTTSQSDLSSTLAREFDSPTVAHFLEPSALPYEQVADVTWSRSLIELHQRKVLVSHVGVDMQYAGAYELDRDLRGAAT